MPSANGRWGSWSKSVATSTPGSGTESTLTHPGRMSRPQPRFSLIPVALRRWVTSPGAVAVSGIGPEKQRAVSPDPGVLIHNRRLAGGRFYAKMAPRRIHPHEPAVIVSADKDAPH